MTESSCGFATKKHLNNCTSCNSKYSMQLITYTARRNRFLSFHEKVTQTFNPQIIQVKFCISKKMIGSKVPSYLDNFILLCCRLQLLFIYFSAILSIIATPPCLLLQLYAPPLFNLMNRFLPVCSIESIHPHQHARICLMISYIFDVCNPLSSRLRGKSFVQLQSAEFFVVVF